MSNHANEIQAGERFAFGENWKNFLDVLNDERIEKAKHSLRHRLNVESLEGKTFLDAGSGSGLFSLAARFLLGGGCAPLTMTPKPLHAQQN